MTSPSGAHPLPGLDADRLWAGLRAGASCFDQGEYWLAHEAWEGIWRDYRGDDRDYLKGLIQLAAVNYHLQRGKLSAARRLLDTAVHYLEHCNPLTWPFDTGFLLLASAALASGLNAGRHPRPLRLGLAGMLEHWAPLV